MKVICFLLIFLSVRVLAQINPGPRLTALGTSGTALQDTWAVGKNQAGLSEIKRIVAGVSYEQRFVDEDINIQSAVVIFPKLKNVFALSFNRYGISAYNEQNVSLACARKWGDISIGLGFNYHQLKIHQYGSSDAVSVNLGFQYELSESLTLGAHLTNPTRSGYDNEISAGLPVLMVFGTAFKMSDKVLLSSDIQTTINDAVSLKLGAEYSLVEWLALRGGVSSHPIRQYFGFGVNYQRFRLDAATYTQYYLGFSPQIGLSYEF